VETDTEQSGVQCSLGRKNGVRQISSAMRSEMDPLYQSRETMYVEGGGHDLL
jgi:hypothetical protein